MNCSEITKKVIEIQTLSTNVASKISDGRIGEAFADHGQIRETVKEILAQNDPFQIRERDMIAQELGFDWVGPIYGGRVAWVKDNSDRYHLLNLKDKTAFRRAELARVTNFYNGVALVQYNIAGKQYVFMVNEDGETIEEYYGTTNYFDDTKYRSDYHGELIPIEYEQDGSNFLGYLNHQGKKEISGPMEMHGSEFSDGVAWMDGKKMQGKFWLMDTTGDTLFTTAATQAFPFKNGHAIIAGALSVIGSVEFTHWFTIDKNGVKKSIGHFSSMYDNRQEGLFIGKNLDDTNVDVAFDTAGREIYRTKEGEHFDGIFADGMAIICTGAWPEIRCCYIGKNGQSIPGEFRSASYFSEGLAHVLDVGGEQFYYIDKEGKKAFGEKKFVGADSFQDGMAIVEDEKGHFVIDKTGRDLYHGKRFETMYYDGFGVFRIREDKKEFFTDSRGKEVFKNK